MSSALTFVNKHRKLISIGFYLSITLFIYLYIRSLDFQSLKVDILHPPAIVASLAVGIFSIFWGSVVWRVVLKELGASNIPTRAMTYVYAKSWLGRYIPGTAAWVLGKIAFASSLGIPKKKLAISSLLEAMYQVIATILIAISLIFLSGKSIQLPVVSWVLLLLGILLGLLFIRPKVFSLVVNYALKILKKDNLAEKSHTSLSLNVKGVLLYFIGALTTGLSIYLLYFSTEGTFSFSDLLYIMGSSNLAAIIGMLAVFMPSGLGVREVSFVALLTVIMPVEQAVLFSVLARFWSVVLDLTFFLLSWIFFRVDSN